jgi:hypothetical protein
MGKKKKKIIPEEFEPAFALGGLSLGSSLLGGALGTKLPAGNANPLTSIGTTTSKFIAPVATLGVMNFSFKQFNKLNKQMKGGNK